MCGVAEALCFAPVQVAKASSLDELDEAGPQEEEAARNRLYDQVHCSSVSKLSGTGIMLLQKTSNVMLKSLLGNA